MVREEVFDLLRSVALGAHTGGLHRCLCQALAWKGWCSCRLRSKAFTTPALVTILNRVNIWKRYPRQYKSVNHTLSIKLSIYFQYKSATSLMRSLSKPPANSLATSENQLRKGTWATRLQPCKCSCTTVHICSELANMHANNAKQTLIMRTWKSQILRDGLQLAQTILFIFHSSSACKEFYLPPPTCDTHPSIPSFDWMRTASIF